MTKMWSQQSNDKHGTAHNIWVFKILLDKGWGHHHLILNDRFSDKISLTPNIYSYIIKQCQYKIGNG